MEEHEDVSVGNNGDSESSMRVSVDGGGDETPIGNMGFEGQVEGGESAVDEVGGDCNNGEDIMVEVMGSDVFVDGVCSSGDGGNPDDDDEEEAEVGRGGLVEAGLEIEERFGGGGADNLVSGEVGVLAGGSETESKGSLVVVQTLDRQTQVVTESSSEVVVTTQLETSVVVMEKVATLVDEKSTEGGLVQDESRKHLESVDDGVGVLNEKIAREAGALDNKVGKSETEADIVSSTGIVVGSSSAETPVEEGLNSTDEVPTDASKGIISGSETDPISVVEKVDVKTQNGIAMGADRESCCEHTQVVGNEVAEVHKEAVHSELEVLEADSSKRIPFLSDNNQNVQIKETVGNVVVANSEASDELTERREIAAVDATKALNEVEVPQGDEIVGSEEEQEVKADLKSSLEGVHMSDTCDIEIVEYNKNDTLNIDNSDAPVKVVSANIESISMRKGDHVVGVAAGIDNVTPTLSDVPETDALGGNSSFRKKNDLKGEIECGSTREDGINEVVSQGTFVTAVGSQAALNSVSSHNEGPQDQGQVICNDNSALDGNLSMDLHACDLVVSHEGEIQAVEAINESFKADDSHHEGGEVQGLSEAVGIPNSECLGNSTHCDPTKPGSDVEQEREANDHMIDAEQKGLHRGEEEKGTNEQLKTIEEEKIARRAALKSGSSVRGPQASYQLPTENDSEFSVSDLVWGKVRSHPWWPGQIFDPSESSEKAMKYHKKDCYLVAYFGDRTFAWNEASLLKHFRTHFSLIEKQSNSEAFHSAVDCALEEISRRVELGLACSCIAKDTYEKIKYQIVENTGIRQEASRRYGVDRSASASSFEPDKLVEYVKELAQLPSGGADQLDLVIAKAQLLSLYRLKGYHDLPEFQYFVGLVDNDADIYLPEDKVHSNQMIEHGKPICENGEQLSTVEEKLKSQNSSPHKRKHNLKDSVYPRKKERSLTELMGGTIDSPDDELGLDGNTTGELASASIGKKRRSDESNDDDSLVQDRRKSMFSAHVSNSISPNPRQSFKIGECISRVASQLTGSPSIRKSNGEIFQKVDLSNHRSVGAGVDVCFQTPEDSQRGKMIIPTNYSTPDEMLPKLHLVAQDPMKGYSFLNTIINFFSDFRNSVIPGQYSRRGNTSVDKVGSGRKKRAPRSLIGSPETFEFEDMKDSYWTDRVIQNGSEEQPSRRNKRDYQLVAFEPEDPLQASPRLYSRKKSNHGHQKLAGERQMSSVDERKPDLSPTELVISFPQTESVPSETNLNKMFRRFGPLKESETEVDRETSRARVIFKRCSDAEVAFSSAGKFNIFGPMLVTYKLNYSPSLPFKAPFIAATQDLEDAIAQDMEMAATEYLEEATTQYLEDVSIQYLEDGTTQYLEDGSPQYLDASMQYLEVAMTQNPEDAREENVEDASLQNLEVETTQYMQDAMSQNPIDAGTQNLEGAPSQNLGAAAEQNLEDVAAQNLESPSLDGATVQNEEGAMTQNVEGEKMQNVEPIMTQNMECSTVQNLEVSVTQNLDSEMTQNLEYAMTQNLDDLTTYHMEDAMAQPREDATTQGMEDATTHGMEDVTTHGMEDASTQVMEDATTQGMEDAAVKDMKDAAAQDVKDAMAQHMEDAMAQHMENAMTQNMEDAVTPHMEDATTQHMEDETS